MQGLEHPTSDKQTLELDIVDREDQGLYTCTAKNSQGESQDSLSIIIQCKSLSGVF